MTEEVYRQYSARLLAYAYGICQNRQLSEDIVSEVFMEYIKNPPHKIVASWFYMVCRNKLINRMKRESKIVATSDENLVQLKSDKPSPYSELEKKDAFKLLRELLEKLRPQECEAISLKYFENFSYAEIAEIMNVSVSTVGTLIFRGMERLKTELLL